MNPTGWVSSHMRHTPQPKDVNDDDSLYIVNGLELLAGKWTIYILWALQHRHQRLSGLRRLLPRASKKALTASLRQLQRHGVVVRHNLSGTTLHVEYELADGVREPMITMMGCLREWSTVLTESSSGGDDE